MPPQTSASPSRICAGLGSQARQQSRNVVTALGGERPRASASERNQRPSPTSPHRQQERAPYWRCPDPIVLRRPAARNPSPASSTESADHGDGVVRFTLGNRRWLGGRDARTAADMGASPGERHHRAGSAEPRFCAARLPKDMGVPFRAPSVRIFTAGYMGPLSGHAFPPASFP
jgi:hypothetical protein